MPIFLLKHASTIVYGLLITLLIAGGYAFHNHYVNLKESLVEANKTIIENSIQIEQLANTAKQNSDAYLAQKKSNEQLLLDIDSLQNKVEYIKSHGRIEEITIKESIDNAPEQTKQCLRSAIPEPSVRGLRHNQSTTN